MKKGKAKVLGFGTDCPPLKGHVEIYFQQKGQSLEIANAFIDHYESKNWNIKDWKAAAFHWLLHKGK